MTDRNDAVSAPPLRLILVSLMRADFLVMRRNRRSLVLSIALPVILLVTTRTPASGVHFGGSLFIIGLCISYGLLSTSLLGYALTLARDREQGVFQRLRVTPAPTWTIMVSRLTMQTLANLIIAFVVVVVGARIHHLALSAGDYALVLLISVVGGAVFLSIGQTLVGLVRSADTVNASARIIYIALVFFGLFGLSDVLGPTMRSLARWSPVGILMTMFSGALDLSTWSTSDSLALLASVGYIAVFSAIGIRWFRWDAS